MDRPIINFDQLEYEEAEGGPFRQSFADISGRIGAKKLGYNLTVVLPGDKACPFHNHHVEEEMFFILDGEGILRFGDKEYPIRPFDVIACPPGGRDLAHQIINTGKVDLKYLAVSTKEAHEICEYPDSNKIMVCAGEVGRRNLRMLFKADQTVNYLDGEDK